MLDPEGVALLRLWNLDTLDRWGGDGFLTGTDDDDDEGGPTGGILLLPWAFMLFIFPNPVILLLSSAACGVLLLLVVLSMMPNGFPGCGGLPWGSANDEGPAGAIPTGGAKAANAEGPGFGDPVLVPVGLGRHDMVLGGTYT